MKNEEKILELLTEVLKNQDQQKSAIQLNSERLERVEHKVDTLIGVVARQNTALQSLARDVNDLKGMKVDIEELKRRVDELERYVGKK